MLRAAIGFHAVKPIRVNYHLDLTAEDAKLLARAMGLPTGRLALKVLPALLERIGRENAINLIARGAVGTECDRLILSGEIEVGRSVPL